MSLEARLTQGLHRTAERIEADVDTNAALLVVTEGVRRRQRNQLLAFAAATLAIVLALVAGPRIADLLLGLEPLPPAHEERQDQRNRLENDGDVDRDGSTIDEMLKRRPDGRTVSRRDGEDDAPGLIASGAGGERPRSGGRDRRADTQHALAGEEPSGGIAQEPPVQSPDVPPRTESKNYTLSSLPVSGGSSGCDQNGSTGDGNGCVRFQADKGEHWVEISIEDEGSPHVSAWVQIDRDGDGTTDGDWTEICDTTIEPIKVRPSATVKIELKAGDCDGNNSQPTTGRVKATFSR